MKNLLSLILTLFLSQSLFAKGKRPSAAELVDSHLASTRLQASVSDALSRRPSASLVPGVFRQNIDHFGHLPGQGFGQRYWVDSEFATSPDTAPVILHICGESDAETGYYLTDNAAEWARSLGAHVVYLEHRYYGKSRPFADLSNETLQYLTLDNVIEDLANFQSTMSTSQGWKGKWVVIGGSYSGTLAAIYRQKHPEMVVGALASSAPMLSAVDAQSSIDVSTDLDNRTQWLYQSCTTFNFWEAVERQLLGPSPELCRENFGNIPLADSAAYNKKYYYPYLSSTPQSPSNIFFTYGSSDIWSRLGLRAEQSKNPNITIKMIPWAGHHYDLNHASSSDTQDVIDAREMFTTFAKTWLGQ